MTDRWRIRLTTTELMVAGYIGTGRNVQLMTTTSYTPPGGAYTANSWRSNIEGAAGEMATGKALGIYYEPTIGKFHAPDVGPYEVRTNSSRAYDDTCVRRQDKADRVYISVLSFWPEFELIGWIWGAHAKRDEWLRYGDPDREKSFWVPRAALRKMDELPTVAELKAGWVADDPIEEMMEFAREVLR